MAYVGVEGGVRRAVLIAVLLACAAACGGGSSGPSPTIVTDTLFAAPELDGWSDGRGYGFYGFPARTGDYDRGRGGTEEPPYFQFVGFHLPARRSDATLLDVTLVLDQCAAFGSPFATEGALVLDHMDYGAEMSLDAFATPPLTAAIATLPSSVVLGYRLIKVTNAVQADWVALRGRSAFRTRFAGAHHGNGLDDFVVFRDSGDVDCEVYPGAGGVAAPDRVPRLLLRYQY